jgi:hypothetical protein
MKASCFVGDELIDMFEVVAKDRLDRGGASW